MNKSVKEAVTLISIIGIGTAAAFLGITCYQCATNRDFTCPAPFSLVLKPTTTTASVQSSVSNQGAISFSDYTELSDGISYNQAVAVLGSQGKELSRVNIAGAPETIVYMWQNPDGSNLNATFQNDKLTVKAQFGLK